MEEDKDKREESDLEKEWADKLGMDYDPERAAKTPPPFVSSEPFEVHEPNEDPAPYGYSRPYAPQPAPQPHPQPEIPTHPQVREPMPPTYLLWAILATICCCVPAGIVAIVFASQVSSKYFARDYEGARRASRKAEIWIIASIVAGVIFGALYVPMMLMQSALMGL